MVHKTQTRLPSPQHSVISLTQTRIQWRSRLFSCHREKHSHIWQALSKKWRPWHHVVFFEKTNPNLTETIFWLSQNSITIATYAMKKERVKIIPLVNKNGTKLNECKILYCFRKCSLKLKKKLLQSSKAWNSWSRQYEKKNLFMLFDCLYVQSLIDTKMGGLG